MQVSCSAEYNSEAEECQVLNHSPQWEQDQRSRAPTFVNNLTAENKLETVDSKVSNIDFQLTAAEPRKTVTRSDFELQKRLSTQNASPINFLNILVNKFYHTRPPTSVFGDHNMNNSC